MSSSTGRSSTRYGKPRYLWNDGERSTIRFVRTALWDIGRRRRRQSSRLSWIEQSESQGCTNPGGRSVLLYVFLCLLLPISEPLSAPKEDGEFFPIPQRNHVTFWGHACCYIDVDGFGIVIDPVFAGRYFVRIRKIPVPPAQSRAGTRLILVSHAHMDHLNKESIAMFPDSAMVLCPWTVAERLEDSGRAFTVMRPGDIYEYPHGKVVAVRAEHPGKRFSLRRSSEDGAIGFVITTPYGTIYYSGDTEYFEGMIDIGSAWQLEIAILNIGPHLSGANAVRAVWVTRANVVLPVHFGAYDYILIGPLKSPRGYDEIEEMVSEQAVLLQPGESISLKRAARKATD
jgi:L-ascorbate metabolism protein UlaG (beta-lactamase superfamily)